MILLIRPKNILAPGQKQLCRLLLRVVIELRQYGQPRHDFGRYVVVEVCVLLHYDFVKQLEREEFLFGGVFLRLGFDHFLDKVDHLLLDLQRRLRPICA